MVQGINSVSYIGLFEAVGAMEGRKVEYDCPDPVVVTSPRSSFPCFTDGRREIQVDIDCCLPRSLVDGYLHITYPQTPT